MRPIPMLKPPGGLAGAEPAALTAAPARPRQGGPFNAFCTDGGPPGQLWVVRPIPRFSTNKNIAGCLAAQRSLSRRAPAC